MAIGEVRPTHGACGKAPANIEGGGNVEKLRGDEAVDQPHISSGDLARVHYVVHSAKGRGANVASSRLP